MIHPGRPSFTFLSLLVLAVVLPVGADEIITLEVFQVDGLPPADSVNPLVVPVTGVFGDGRGLLETPRSVSLISSALFRERTIHGVKEILQYVPGAYAPARYGRTANPNIRGDTAEIYLNGQRRGNNLFGYFPSFNGVESVEMVRGAGSVVYGPAFFSGGYVNYVTKTPNLERSRTEVTTRFGTWVPSGGSHLNGSVQIDHTAPLEEGVSGYRVSYEGKGGDTYHHRNGVKDDRQDLFAAWSWRPSENLSVEINGQFQWQNTPQTNGINRPSQGMIDEGIYFQGWADDRATGILSGLVTPTGTVEVDPRMLMFSRGDFSDARVLELQGVVRARFSETFSLVNRTLFESVDRRRYHSFEYTEYAEQLTLENRTELRWRGDQDWKPALTGGLTVRLEERESFVNYFNEYLYAGDISGTETDFGALSNYPGSYYPGQAGPDGREFFGSENGIPETTDSRVWNPALFLQVEVEPFRNLNLMFGVRGDAYSVEVEDALPPAGTRPISDRDSFTTPSGQACLSWTPVDTGVFYLAWNSVAEIYGSVTGGGVLQFYPPGTIRPEDYDGRSDLLEAGAKFAFDENRLFLGISVFQQNRSRAEFGGGRNEIETEGLEAEVVYQPRRGVYLTANAAWMDANYVNSAPTQLGGRSLYDMYPAGMGPEGKGTGVGYDFWFVNQVPVGDYRISGLSKVLLNASAAYRFENGLGLSLQTQWQSPQWGNLDREYQIPAQLTVQASVTYTRPGWEVGLDCLNLTNARNWIHNGDEFMNNQLISLEPPIRFEGYLKMRW
ncbi:MAG: TonB-dependent receptor plug domain-containing protein [Opitutaceae bacterium]